jgi:hypothetical protein
MKKLAPILIALAAAGCGYHVAGRAELVPKDVKIIAVPAFGNATTRYDLARLLPADITREFISRTHYTIVTDPNAADAVLNGTVVNYYAFPTTADPVSGRATGVQIAAILNLTLTDRHTGKAIYSRQGAEFRERYEIPIDPKDYFDESGTAVRRVSRDVARDVVSSILEAF